jgi:CspA family cold shock protein
LAAARRAEPSQSEILLAFWHQLHRLLDVDIIGTGIIKKLTDKGFGFITPIESERDIFFHSTELIGIIFDELKAGDHVSFSVEEGRGGQFAIAISRL